jgi:hypothetical protein
MDFWDTCILERHCVRRVITCYNCWDACILEHHYVVLGNRGCTIGMANFPAELKKGTFIQCVTACIAVAPTLSELSVSSVSSAHKLDLTWEGNHLPAAMFLRTARWGLQMGGGGQQSAGHTSQGASCRPGSSSANIRSNVCFSIIPLLAACGW